MGGQKTVGKTLPPKTGPKTPFTADAAASQIARQRLGSLAADHEGESINAMKMMSLFDGSGGFPLAAAICGIEPVYASEVEPYPIAVTRSLYPAAGQRWFYSFDQNRRKVSALLSRVGKVPYRQAVSEADRWNTNRHAQRRRR